ncbi:hypothetical protein DFR70_1011175 [Nocardia tenerifensis]|uniref:Acyltransferase PapA5 n=1 Tax=Nocardia tenerifensis TaxID=228006 RepID=A0A318KB37_9NOCA|nr:hypothetical protein [Nocardia tenerifensis]PXX71741.1 hypothetical protein DFR70_1011175 [Nocardia tenerifensis]
MPVVKVIRSVVTPGIEEVRTWLADWAVAHPDDVRVRLLSVEQGCTGQPAPGYEAAFLHALVAGSAECGPSNSSLDPAGLDLGGLPFRLTLGHDWARLSYSHALGDGTATWYFLGMLLGDRHPRPGPVIAEPLGRGLLATFGPPRSRLPQAITRQRELRHLRAPAPARAAGSAVRPSSFAVTTAVSAESFTQGAREFRVSRGPASVMSIMTMRAMLLCRHYGLTVDDTVTFMVDLRRYLSPGASVDGNFSWSKSVPVSASDTPTRLSARIGGILDSGLPLLNFGDALRRFEIRRAGRPPAWCAGDRTVRLMIAYATEWTNTPRPTGSATPRLTASIAPPSPNFLGFNVVEAYGRIHLSLNWCTATLDRAVAERIAAEFVADLGTGPVDASLWPS